MRIHIRPRALTDTIDAGGRATSQCTLQHAVGSPRAECMPATHVVLIEILVKSAEARPVGLREGLPVRAARKHWRKLRARAVLVPRQRQTEAGSRHQLVHVHLRLVPHLLPLRLLWQLPAEHQRDSQQQRDRHVVEAILLENELA